MHTVCPRLNNLENSKIQKLEIYKTQFRLQYVIKIHDYFIKEICERK